MYFIPYAKINSKRITDLHVSTKTMQEISEQEKNLHDYLYKKKISKLDFKITNFSSSKDIINNMKKQITDQKKIFSNDISDKKLVLRI